jgi:hypothetical protein
MQRGGGQVASPARGPRPRATELFLLPSDEEEILAEIRNALPGAALIDHEWQSASSPPLRDRVADCAAFVGLWNRAAHPWISGSARSNGRVETPQSDYIVEWQRSIERLPGILTRGRWITTLTVSDAPEMTEFVRVAWRILFRMTTDRLRCLSCSDPLTPERRFRVGKDAFQVSKTGKLALAADAMRLAPELDADPWAP